MIRFRKLSPHATIPTRAHPGDAGLDLFACMPDIEEVYILPGTAEPIPTRIAVAIPPGHVGLVCPRSGLAAKKNVTVLNAPGIIDSGYRGEVVVLLINHMATKQVRIGHGDRIAQLVIVRVRDDDPLEVEMLDETERGAGGFGSTGK